MEGMWLPVLESRLLKKEPVQVHYWGSPVALFRTESGVVGALEDHCPHRGAPLARGDRKGDTLRCPYHRFAFDTSGSCLSTPAHMQISEQGRERCSARRYYVREALGLIWISIESEQSVPFPAELTALSETFFTIRFDEIEGPLQPWLDHYLDVGHLVSNHSQSTTGQPLDTPVIAEASTSLPEDLEQRPEATITVTGSGVLRPGIIGGDALWWLYLGGLRSLLRGLQAGDRISSQMIGHGVLLNPAIQHGSSEYRSPLGSAKFDVVTAMNPRSANRIQIVNIIASRQQGSWLKRLVERWEMPHVIGSAHVFGEDYPVVSGIERSDLADYQLVSRLDETVPVMRARLARYIAAKGHLYPRDSVLHALKDGLPEVDEPPSDL